MWADAALTVAHPNPLTADDRGSFPPMFMETGTYKTVLQDANGAVVWTDDPVDGDNPGGGEEAVALMRNVAVNGSMQVSAENGANNVDATTGSVYTLDQWVSMLSTAPGGTLRVNQEVFSTPGGNRYRLRAISPVADATLAAGDFYAIATPLEGADVSSAAWGTSRLRRIILRFGVRSSVAGTYCVSASNDMAGSRSWVGTYTISADEVGQDLVRTLVIPGDAAGTWNTDENIGIVLRWALGVGASYQGAAGWQAGNIYATSAQVNWMAGAINYFRIFDVGVYVDRVLIAVAPNYEPPSIEEEVARSRRFWRIATTSLGFSATGTTQGMMISAPLSPPMRAIPTVIPTASVSVRTNVDAAYPAALDILESGFTAFILSAGAGFCEDRGRVWTISARY